jgi:ribosomal protein L11 methyltransferase
VKYPALEVSGAHGDLLEALVDDFSPTAAEHHDNRTTFFFADGLSRARAQEAIARAWPGASIETREVDDEDWARRSQENLGPVTVGRVTIAPPWHVQSILTRQSLQIVDTAQKPSAPDERQHPSPIVLAVAPSMGFGTGHHATTRLCLRALQTLDLTDRLLLDVGTGSGVLALAGRVLGAASAIGLDHEVDAIQAALENLSANPSIGDVDFVVGDVRDVGQPPADIVTANLTGTSLVEWADRLLALVRPGGTLIVSGLLVGERAGVVTAFSRAARLIWEQEEEGWIGLAFKPEGGKGV